MDTELDEPIATRLPEIVCKILTYLSPTDLLSCTGVSSIWDSEARKALLKTVTSISLCCSTVSQYFEDMAVRNHAHTSIKLSTCNNKDCLQTLIAKLMENKCLSRVTFLSTEWAPDLEWGTDFELWSFLDNLNTLELRPCQSSEGATIVRWYSRLVADICMRRYCTRPVADLVFPSVHTVIWGLSVKLLSLIPPLCLFPNVKTLKFDNGQVCRHPDTPHYWMCPDAVREDVVLLL